MPRKKGVSLAPKNETKRARFERLAESRVNKALKSIKTIGKLSNRSQYEFNQPDVDSIIGALKQAAEEVEYSLGGDGSTQAGGWKLGGKSKTS